MKRKDQLSNWTWETNYENLVRKEIKHAPWILRITEHKDKPIPVLIIKEHRLSFDDENNHEENNHEKNQNTALKDRGLLYGSELIRCIPIIRALLSRVKNEDGIPLELHRVFETQRISFRGNLPLDDEAGYKLALLFKLQERIKGLDRVELMALRISSFSKEEAGYWYSRITDFSPAANRWAQAGLKILLAGHPHDNHVTTMLEKLRLRS